MGSYGRKMKAKKLLLLIDTHKVGAVYVKFMFKCTQRHRDIIANTTYQGLLFVLPLFGLSFVCLFVCLFVLGCFVLNVVFVRHLHWFCTQKQSIVIITLSKKTNL